jgi:hypothetical protein
MGVESRSPAGHLWVVAMKFCNIPPHHFAERAASPEHVSGDNAESMMAQTYGFNSFMKTKSMANVQKSSQSHDTNGGESPRTGLKGAFKKKKGMAYFYNPYS